MYKSFFHLQHNPFGGSPDPRFLYMMPHTREALAGLEFGISTRKGFIVLTGEVGTGKTTLLRRALTSFDPTRVLTSFIFNPRLEVLDFLEFVLCDFGLTPTSRTKSAMLIQLNRWLVERFRQEQICVIVVDEAQNLSWELLEEIRLLTNLEASSEKLLQIVLSGQPEFEDKLRQTELRQLRQRVALWCRTQPLTEEQTMAYIDQRLLIARAQDSNSSLEIDQPIFSRDAIPLIHRASRGIPRIINLICEHSLIFAYVEDLHHIPPSMVSAVIQDLDLEPRSFAIASTLHESGEAVSKPRSVSALPRSPRPQATEESGQDR
jgi:general secretion pathway protein A